MYIHNNNENEHELLQSKYFKIRDHYKKLQKNIESFYVFVYAHVRQTTLEI